MDYLVQLAVNYLDAARLHRVRPKPESPVCVTYSFDCSLILGQPQLRGCVIDGGVYNSRHQAYDPGVPAPSALSPEIRGLPETNSRDQFQRDTRSVCVNQHVGLASHSA